MKQRPARFFAHPDAPPPCAAHLVARLIWHSGERLTAGRPVLLRRAADIVPCRVMAVRSRLDMMRFLDEATDALACDDIGLVSITADHPIAVDCYEGNRSLGAFLLVDPITQATLATGTVIEVINPDSSLYWQKFDIRLSDRPTAKKQTPAILWLTGPSGAGKSTVANTVERLLTQAGYHAYVLDGDNVRHGLNRDLGFTPAERAENVRRLAEVARILADAGLLTIVAAIAPFARDRAHARAIAGDIPFYEVFVDTPLELCAARDPKGLYERARRGLVRNFTGVSAPYERPVAPDLHLDGASETPIEEARRILNLLMARGHLRPLRPEDPPTAN